MSVRVNQTRQQNLFTQVDDLARVACCDGCKTADIGNFVSCNRDSAIFYRRAIHRYDGACANDHKWIDLRPARRGSSARHDLATFCDEKIAGLLAEQRNARFAGAGLILLRVEFFRRQFRRRRRATCIAFPQDRSQTSAIRSAKICDNIIELCVRNRRGDAIHS